MRRTSSYSLRFSASPSTSYAAFTSLKRSSDAALPGVGVGVMLLGQLLVGARQLLLGRARRNAEHGVVVLVEPLALCCQETYLTTFTIAGRSTRPFNFQPVRNTSPTSRLAVAVVLHDRFVLVRVERRARARRSARGRPARGHRTTRRTRARFPCARARCRRRASRLASASSKLSSTGRSCSTRPSVARSTSAVCSRSTRLR